MRIVSGALRGRVLVAPKGHSTRPTADRVRQALFNVLEHAAWAPALAGARVADLFAGSGALGLEALSRGATFCLFADRDRGARETIQANATALGLRDRCDVSGADVARLPPRSTLPPFDLVFLDPPYAEGLIQPTLEALASGKWLAENALVVAETGARERVTLPARYQLLDQRTWGAAKVAFHRLSDDAEARP